MSDPTIYVPSYSFSGWQATNPSKPLPAPQVDNELANISTCFSQTITALEDIRRSDGQLQNGIVTVDSLSPSITLGFMLKGAWTLGVHYIVGDGVFYGGKCYRCQVVNDATNANRPDVDTVTWTFLYSTTDLAGAMSIATYDPTGIGADVFARANHTGTQAIATVSGLQPALDAKASLTGAETLTNKTLTSPTINSPTITAPSGLLIQGRIYGLTLSNNATDATNDIDIAAGWAASDAATPVMMPLAGALTKRLDAAWAVGTNQGGLDTGSIANTTYHVWLIQRSDTGVVDALFSTSATSPTMPTSYDRKRRIGSVIREGAVLVAFKQDGNLFRRAAKQDRSSTAAQASALLTLSVPIGVNVYPLLTYDMSAGAVSTDAQLFFGGAWEGSAAVGIDRVFTTSLANTASTARGGVPSVFQTNTSAQVYFAVTISTGSLNLNTLTTIGWVDNRGTA